MTLDIIIRVMEEKDIHAAIALWKECFRPDSSAYNETPEIIARYLRRNPGLSTVAITADGRLAGTLLCGHDGRRGSLFHAAVAPAFRRRGIADAMQRRSLETLRAEGIEGAFLHITTRNPGSEEFWISAGWELRSDVHYLYRAL
jgi:ribosomal protein S18 acetylase RimI-like enzyme